MFVPVEVVLAAHVGLGGARRVVLHCAVHYQTGQKQRILVRVRNGLIFWRIFLKTKTNIPEKITFVPNAKKLDVLSSRHFSKNHQFCFAKLFTCVNLIWFLGLVALILHFAKIPRPMEFINCVKSCQAQRRKLRCPEIAFFAKFCFQKSSLLSFQIAPNF